MLLDPVKLESKLGGMQGLPKVPVCAVPSLTAHSGQRSCPVTQPCSVHGNLTLLLLFLQTSNT